MFGAFILILLLVLLIALLPTWPYSRGWGYYPGGIVVALLLFWLVLIWLGYIALWHPWRPAPVVEGPAVIEGEAPDAIEEVR